MRKYVFDISTWTINSGMSDPADIERVPETEWLELAEMTEDEFVKRMASYAEDYYGEGQPYGVDNTDYSFEDFRYEFSLVDYNEEDDEETEIYHYDVWQSELAKATDVSELKENLDADGSLSDSLMLEALDFISDELELWKISADFVEKVRKWCNKANDKDYISEIKRLILKYNDWNEYKRDWEIF